MICLPQFLGSISIWCNLQTSTNESWDLQDALATCFTLLQFGDAASDGTPCSSFNAKCHPQGEICIYLFIFLIHKSSIFMCLLIWDPGTFCSIWTDRGVAIACCTILSISLPLFLGFSICTGATFQTAWHWGILGLTGSCTLNDRLQRLYTAADIYGTKNHKYMYWCHMVSDYHN